MDEAFSSGSQVFVDGLVNPVAQGRLVELTLDARVVRNADEVASAMFDLDAELPSGKPWELDPRLGPERQQAQRQQGGDPV
jgi:hypothetical protein